MCAELEILKIEIVDKSWDGFLMIVHDWDKTHCGFEPQWWLLIVGFQAKQFCKCVCFGIDELAYMAIHHLGSTPSKTCPNPTNYPYASTTKTESGLCHAHQGRRCSRVQLRSLWLESCGEVYCTFEREATTKWLTDVVSCVFAS